jgi:hypothetical protein
MRACTAVITEIAYHSKKTIDADISFLDTEEWKAELEILLFDLTDDDGRAKRVTDLKAESKVAWDKVHAVYPLLHIDVLCQMTPEEIVDMDPSESTLGNFCC